ncbi:MAG: hypothetical protein J6B86_06965 [Clostridia bacterium]|nr:hypothetical protein [Clostridia bacterium]
MLTLNRKNHCGKISVGAAVAVIAAAHIAAGVILCKGACHPAHSLQRMVKRAKRTVVGLIREII